MDTHHPTGRPPAARDRDSPAQPGSHPIRARYRQRCDTNRFRCQGRAGRHIHPTRRRCRSRWSKGAIRQPQPNPNDPIDIPLAAPSHHFRQPTPGRRGERKPSQHSTPPSLVAADARLPTAETDVSSPATKGQPRSPVPGPSPGGHRPRRASSAAKAAGRPVVENEAWHSGQCLAEISISRRCAPRTHA